MANDLSTRQWRLDSPAPYLQYGPASILWDSNVFIKQIEFMSYASQGNLCTLLDKIGRPIWVATGAADLTPIRLGDIGWVDGIVLDTLDNAAGGQPTPGPPGGSPIVWTNPVQNGSICVIYIK